MKTALIVAMGNNGEIGYNNDLLWHLPRDMKFFRETTTGHVVVMGRKNWDSIPVRFRPLKDRENVVLTRNTDFKLSDAETLASFDEVVAKYFDREDPRTCFIIGGAQIYKLALDSNKIEELYITHVDESFKADTYFPDINLEEWNSEVLLKHEKDAKNPYSFTIKRYFK